MFPNLEFIKTMLNGLRSRIEKVEKSISQALASVKAQFADIIQDIKNVRKESSEAIKSSTADWNQNDPDALDYVKNRTHWDDESQTQTIDYNAWKGERPSIPLILGVWYEVSWSSELTAHAYVQYMNTDEADGRFECKQNSAGELYVGFESGSPFCIFSDRTEINTSWFQVNRVDGLRLTGEITTGLHQLDKKYISRDVLNEIHTLGKSVEYQNSALSSKMNAADPTGIGSFSLNRKANSASGEYSFVAGYNATASGLCSFAAGQNTTAVGNYSFVTGRNNVIDDSGKYLHIVGKGIGSERSNAYTLDWNGNGWFSGDVFVRGFDPNTGFKLLQEGEAIPIPQTASVGQVLAVKAVDKNGKPTKWEAADIGGWELITDVTLTEDGGAANQFNVTKNDKGEDFEYRQCMVCLSGKVVDGWPKGAYISLELYESNKLTGSKASISLSRLTAGAGGTEYKTTVEISIFGNLVRTIACGGSGDTSSLIFRSDASIDTFRSIKMSGYGNNQWVSVPLAAGGRVVIYGRK